MASPSFLQITQRLAFKISFRLIQSCSYLVLRRALLLSTGGLLGVLLPLGWSKRSMASMTSSLASGGSPLTHVATISPKTSIGLFLSIRISIMSFTGVLDKPNSEMFLKPTQFTNLRWAIAKAWTFWQVLYLWYQEAKRNKLSGFSMQFWRSLTNRYLLTVFQGSLKRSFLS